MAYKIKGKIEGLRDVLAALDNVEKKVKKKAIRKAAGVAGTIVLKAAKARARKATGLLRKSLGKKIKVYKSGAVGVAIVGPRLGFRQVVSRGGRDVLSNPTKYAHLVELGTSHSAAHPFLRSALEQTRGQVREAMAKAIAEVVAGGK